MIKILCDNVFVRVFHLILLYILSNAESCRAFVEWEKRQHSPEIVKANGNILQQTNL